jgi:hypothetical protein
MQSRVAVFSNFRLGNVRLVTSSYPPLPSRGGQDTGAEAEVIFCKQEIRTTYLLHKRPKKGILRPKNDQKFHHVANLK